MDDIIDFENDNHEDLIKQSKFNAGIAKLIRLDSLHKHCQRCRLSGNYRLWYETLLALRNEIDERLNDLEKKQISELATNTARAIELYQEEIIYNYNAQKQNKPLKRITPNYYNLLDQLERYIYNLEYTYGFSMPLKSIAAEATDKKSK